MNTFIILFILIQIQKYLKLSYWFKILILINEKWEYYQKKEFILTEMSNLESTTKMENEMECCVLLDRVILESVPVFKLLASEDQTLLIMRNTFSVLDLGLDVFDLVCWFDFECDALACECLYEELHKEKWNELLSRQSIFQIFRIFLILEKIY